MSLKSTVILSNPRLFAPSIHVAETRLPCGNLHILDLSVYFLVILFNWFLYHHVSIQ